MTRGITLVELVVALAVMALLLAVGSLAIPALGRPTRDPVAEAVHQGRRRAITSGTPVSMAIEVPGAGMVTLRFLPGGRVIGEGVDPWTGGPTDAPE